ncbi:unnamed protein product [Bursaphelenchus xylophilus]|uniref:(pine wood nematode) hypothetical protein n=1 Tax=Bursaphelenchus xylophilus TaxID=6326 RepID=A0A1I7RZ15_BURXY|nr:unnamed protein product [Bursaphelenchus xylophilus]CAG9106954.1 unnamed protein product [Bursaphelenchus xylophilus]
MCPGITKWLSGGKPKGREEQHLIREAVVCPEWPALPVSAAPFTVPLLECHRLGALIPANAGSAIDLSRPPADLGHRGDILFMEKRE